jgi:uncharacterized membrane protein YoaT (DUF817 family)
MPEYTSMGKIMAKDALLLIFFAAYYIVIDVLFFNDNILLLVLVIIGGIAIFSLWHEKDDVIFFVIGTVAGAIVEIVCVHFGVWSYANPYFLGIPLWLAPDWGFYLVVLNRAEKFVKKLMA